MLDMGGDVIAASLCTSSARAVALAGDLWQAAVRCAGGSAGLVWRRRSQSTLELARQLGRSDGSVLTLDLTDTATAELQTLAAGVRDSLIGGA